MSIHYYSSKDYKITKKCVFLYRIIYININTSMKNINFTDGTAIKIENILCIGQNYSEHNKEMGTKPHNQIVIFTKPNSSVIYDGEEVIIPSISNNMHHEVEMLIAIGKDAYDIEESQARDIIAGVGIGVDLTLRDVQAKAKESGKPWATAKGFYTSAPISKFIPMKEIDSFEIDLKLEVNGATRQLGNTRDMIHSVDKLVAYISKVFSLQAGDIIFTGTPAGVGQLVSGDKAKATLGDNLLSLEFSVR